MKEIKLAFGSVTAKKIMTPNHFVSHMIEHIAWRLGCSIDLEWENDDWGSLGRMLGAHIGSFAPFQQSAAAMGMLDDGSAEALVESVRPGLLEITAGSNIDLEWFLSLRCEQVPSGRPLVDLLTGLAEGLPARITVAVCNLEDPHHTWEGVFRAVGSALSKMFTPPSELGTFITPLETDIDLGDIVIASRSGNMAEIRRGTAESGLSALVDFKKRHPFVFRYEGAPIEHYRETGALESFEELLRTLAGRAGFSTQLTFTSKVLGSSHVLLEDTGMALGLALREVLVRRMMEWGVNGGGDSFQAAADFHDSKIRVALSVEGRKFWRFVPLSGTYDHLKKNLIIGRTVMNGLYSEDLDDFLDGLSWGLGCSIMIHIKKLPPPDEAWCMIFENLGRALRETFEINPYRRGVPPGVKANLS